MDIPSVTPTCHASTIAVSGNTLVAAWFGGEYEKHPEVGIYVARCDAGEWSPPVRVVGGGQPDGTSVACWNPVLFRMPDPGPLLLFYKIGAEIAGWQSWLIASHDDGAHWTEPRWLGGGIEGPVRNKPVLIDGTLVCPSSTEPDWRHWLTYFSLSEDGGESWTLVGPLNDPAQFQAIQPTLLTHADGTLQALCRTRQGVVAEIRSNDGGRSWSSMRATKLPNPNAAIDAVTLEDGRHLLVYNHSTAARTPLNAAVSEDGRDWRVLTVLEDAAGEYSYPAVIEDANGTVHVTYTNDRRCIAYKTLVP